MDALRSGVFTALLDEGAPQWGLPFVLRQLRQDLLTQRDVDITAKNAAQIDAALVLIERVLTYDYLAAPLAAHIARYGARKSDAGGYGGFTFTACDADTQSAARTAYREALLTARTEYMADTTALARLISEMARWD